MGADLAVGGEEAGDLGDDVFEVAGLVPGVGGEGVAVHRITGPHDGMAGVADRLEQGRQGLDDIVVSHTGDQREPSG